MFSIKYCHFWPLLLKIFFLSLSPLSFCDSYYIHILVHLIMSHDLWFPIHFLKLKKNFLFFKLINDFIRAVSQQNWVQGTDISHIHPGPKPWGWGFPGNRHTGQVTQVILVWGQGFRGGASESVQRHAATFSDYQFPGFHLILKWLPLKLSQNWGWEVWVKQVKMS